jgi:hypothetical protein
MKEGEVDIVEAASGKVIARLPAGPIAHLAFANGGRCLVTTDENFLRVLDLATGKELHRWSLPPGKVESWAVSIVSHLLAMPDGRRVITTLHDGTALVWDLSPAFGSLGRLDPDEETLAAYWSDLAGDDAKRAYAAVWQLADARDSTAAFLRGKLAPVLEPDAKKIRQHIDELDNESFEVRDRASKELESLGRLAVPALRAALEKNPSPEKRRRVETLLATAVDEKISVESLRGLRGLHALEQIGTRDARDLLRKLATGASEARLTREAKMALQRVHR